MRTEANKMHKSIPLRKQETHSASLMTDLGSIRLPPEPLSASIRTVPLRPRLLPGGPMLKI